VLTRVLLFTRLPILTETSVYTVPVIVSEKNQQFSLQIDTGSSDLVRVLAFIPSLLNLTSFPYVKVDCVYFMLHIKL
jgi:hypothetical protein